MNRVKFGCSCSRPSMDGLMARENGGIVFLRQPEGRGFEDVPY